MFNGALWQAEKDVAGLWTFDGGNADDQSGNGYNGTVNGAVINTDKIGKYYTFDGNDNIAVAHGALLNPNQQDFSIEALIRNSAGLGSDGVIYMIAAKIDGGGGNYYELGLRGGSFNGIYANFRNGGILNVYPASSYIATLTNGQWHYVVATFKESNPTATVRLYLDGVEIAPSVTGNTNNVSPTTQLTIGAENFNGTLYYKFNGDIGAVRISKKTLSAEAIALQHARHKGAF